MAKKRNKSSKNRKRLNNLSNAGAFFISVLTIICLTGVIVFGYVFVNVIAVMAGDPVINLESSKNNQNQTSFLYANDSAGKTIELIRLHGEENRIWVDFEKIPQSMKDAFVALEDKRFNDHHGVDWIRTIGVFVKQNDEGGSTITQQLVKNITGNNEVTYVRKFNEIVTALNLEKNYSKEQILEAYLNTLYLGQGCYGVETAAEVYFGKEVSELNVSECAVIASITQKPYTLDPLYHPENNRERQLYCLGEMYKQGKINKTQYDEAVNFDLIFTTDDDYVPSEAELDRQKAQKEAMANTGFQSFYVDYVIDDVIKRLQSDLGYSPSEARDAIYGGGLRIYTAIDTEIQKKVEKIYVNKTNWLDKNAQSAVTVMGYDGRVVAICGQAGEKEGNRILNRASDSPRPPGSTIKPISTYAPAIELNEITWSTYVREYAITYGGELWPQNYAGDHGSGGNVTVQNALARSLNTVPARICVNMIGTSESFKFLKNKFHISTLDDTKDSNPAPLVVGAMTRGITSLELTAAYCSFGNGGYYYKPYSFYYIEDSTGKVLIDNRKIQGEQILSTGTAEVMRHMMQTVTESSIGTGYNYKTRGFTNFAKTGTTDNNYDKWMVGGTPYYCAAVWYGYDTPKTIYTSANPAGRIYKTVMDSIHEDLPEKEFDDLDGAVKRYYCTSTGKLASSSCYSTAVGWYKEDDLPGYCNGHYYSSNKSDDSDEETTTSSIFNRFTKPDSSDDESEDD